MPSIRSALCFSIALLAPFQLGLAADDFSPIFNGRTLDGWTALAGDTSSYYVEDGQLICKGDGRKFIFSEKQYANFVLRFEFKMDPGGNNGIVSRMPCSTYFESGAWALRSSTLFSSMSGKPDVCV